MTAAEEIGPPGRGGLKAVRWRRFIGDVDAVRAAAQAGPVRLGTHPAEQLRTYGVGVPPLWPAAAPPRGRTLPPDLATFQKLTAPPLSCLWVAASTRTQVLASLHVEFVGDLARVCEAQDIAPGEAVGRSFTVRVEPAAHAVDRCLDLVGFAADEPEDRLARLRCWRPVEWTPDAQPHTVPEDRMRSLLVRTERIPGAPVVVTDERRTNLGAEPALPGSPTQAQLRAVLLGVLAGA